VLKRKKRPAKFKGVPYGFPEKLEKECDKGHQALLDRILKSFDVPAPAREYRFHPARRWRLDYAWPDHKLAVEIEGGAWILGRHNRASGFLADMEKYNELTMLGWSLLRFTPKQVRNGTAVMVIMKWFSDRKRRQDRV